MDREFEKEVLERLTRIETKLDDYDSTKTKADEARAKAYTNEHRINELEDKLKWLVRAIIGAVITGGIGIIFAIIRAGIHLN